MKNKEIGLILNDTGEWKISDVLFTYADNNQSILLSKSVFFSQNRELYAKERRARIMKL